MKLKSLAFGFFLTVSMLFSSAGYALATSGQDCLLTWLESAYPQFLQPAGMQSQTWSTYYYRYYPGTQAYAGIEANGGHLWYKGPAAVGMYDLGPVSEWMTWSGCANISGSIDDVQQLMDGVMGLASGALESGVTDQLAPVLEMLLTGDQNTTCPTVTTNLDLANASSLEGFIASFPDPALLRSDYGTGCTTDGGAFISGSANLSVTGFALNPTSGTLNTDLLLTLNHLTSNGLLIGDGQISGNINVLLAGNLSGSGSLSFTNFLLGNGMRLDGSLSLVAQSSSDMFLILNLSADQSLQANLGIKILATGDGVYQISTPSPGSVNNYSVMFDNLVFNEALCAEYPIAGSVVFSQAGQTWRVTFDNRCTGVYSIQ